MDPTDGMLDLVMKNIYASCDPEQNNLVRASTLIDFIKPYMQGEHEALKKLHALLDPESKNICLTSEKFYEVLGAWAKQIAGSNDGQEDVFNRTPSDLVFLDEKQLPFIQSTPRASFGDKLLKSEGILNLSNVSTECLSLSFSGAQFHERSSVAAERMKSLEDHIQYLEHQLGKCTSDADMLKAQLAQADEQNENLQKENERLQIRLHSEQQMNEHLQKRILQNEELTDEINNYKSQICKLEKILQQYKKDSLKWSSDMQKLDDRNAKLDEHCKKLLEKERDLKKQIIDMSEEIQIKDSRISELTEHRDRLSQKVHECNSTIEDLTNDNETKEQEAELMFKIDELSKKNEDLQNQIKAMEIKLSLEIKRKSDLVEEIGRFECEIQKLKIEQDVLSQDCKSIWDKFQIEVEKNEVLSVKNEELTTHMIILQETYENEVSKNAQNVVHIVEKEVYDKEIAKNVELSTQVNMLKKAMVDLEAKLEVGAAENTHHIQSRSELENEMECIATKYEQLCGVYDNVLAENENLKSKILDLENRIVMIQLETQKEAVANTELNQLLQDLKSKMETFTAKHEQLEIDHRNEIAKNMEIATHVCELTKAKDSLIDECTFEHGKNQQLTQEIHQLQNHLAKMNEDYERAVLNSAELQTQVTRLENELDTDSNYVIILKKDHAQKVEKCKRLGDQVLELKSRMEYINGNHDKLMQEYQTEVSTNKELSAKISELQSKIDKYSNESALLSETHKNEITKYSTLVDNLNNKIEILSSHHQKLLEATEKKDDRIAVLAKQVSEMLSKQNEMEVTKEKDISELQSKIDWLLQTKVLLEDKYEKEKETTVQKNERILELKSALHEKCRMIKQLESDKAQLKFSCSIPKHKDYNKKEMAINNLKDKVQDLEERISREISKSHILNNTLSDKWKTEAEMKQKLIHVQVRLDSFRENILSSSDDNVLDKELCCLRGRFDNRWLELDSLSKSDDDKNMALRHVEGLLSENLNQSQEIDEKVNVLRRNINSTKQVLRNIQSALEQYVQTIFECNEELKRVYHLVKNIADNIHNDEDMDILLPDVIECKDRDLKSVSEVIKQNINIIALVLDTLSKKSLFIMDKKQVDQSTLRQFSPNGDSKQFKKFTLKYARSESPDLPSLKVSEVIDTSENEGDDSFINFSNDFPTVLEAFESDALYKIPMLDFDLSFREVFPHLTDNFLLKLGVKEESVEEIGNEDLENRFVQFINYFGSDLNDIKEKLDQQLQICQNQHRQCFCLLNDVTSYVKDHKCVGQGDTANPTYSQLQDLRALLPEIVRSSFSLGTLNCGNHMIKYWNFLVRHMADIQKFQLFNPTKEDSEVGSTSESIDQSDPESTDDNPEIQSTRWSRRVIFKWYLFLAGLIAMAIMYLQLGSRPSICQIARCLLGFVKEVQVGQTPFS